MEYVVPLTADKYTVRLIKLPGHNFEQAWNKFLTGYKEMPVRTLAELVEYNKRHADTALPPGE